MSSPPRRRGQPRASNFRRLDDDTAQTRRVIDAMLELRAPPAWDPNATHSELMELARLAAKIERQADAGRITKLVPATAQTVACVLRAMADGPVSVTPTMKGYGYRVVDYSHEVPEVLAYAENLHLAVGAFNEYVARNPGRRVAVRWGMMTPRKTWTE